MPPSSVHGHFAFTWKMMWHTTWIFRKNTQWVTSFWSHAKCNHMQIYSRDISLSHLILVVASNSNYYECIILSYTRPTCVSVNLQMVRTPPGPSLVKLLVCSYVQRSVEPLVSCSPWSSELRSWCHEPLVSAAMFGGQASFMEFFRSSLCHRIMLHYTSESL